MTSRYSAMAEQSPRPSVSRQGHSNESLPKQPANPLYFPLRSWGFTLLTALILAAGAVLALLSMSGGELFPVPVSIRVGVGVEVFGVASQELNIRTAPGLRQSQILFRAPEGAPLDVVGGPREADGFSWWKVRDRQFQVEGWAVANYLQVTS